MVIINMQQLVIGKDNLCRVCLDHSNLSNIFNVFIITDHVIYPRILSCRKIFKNAALHVKVICMTVNGLSMQSQMQ